jgi:hypothetical protein
MGVAALHTLPDGRSAMIDGALLELDRMLKNGDPVIGWRGDETMWVEVNNQDNVVEVWHLDREMVPYVACSTSPSGGYERRLMEQVIRGDWRRGNDRFTEITAENTAAQKSADNVTDSMQDELAEKLAWAIQKDYDGTNLYGTFFKAKEV